MEKNPECFETLKAILKYIRTPERLDDHPWIQSLVVQETLDSIPHLRMASPGQQLVTAVARLFSNMQPVAPPRHGKRLDPRWGEFGLLAALYFTPFNHGTPFPTSLMEAWKCIDSAILYHVFGKPAGQLTGEQIEKYQVVGDDVDFGSASTLSDWHKKGVQRLADILLDRERFLGKSSSQPSVIVDAKGKQAASSKQVSSRRLSKVRRSLGRVALLILVILLILGGVKARNIYSRGRTVYEDVTQIQELVGAQMGIDDLSKTDALLTTLQNDLSDFKEEARPLLWLSSNLGWVPTYGGDLVSAPELIDVAEHLVNASMISLQAAQPLLKEIDSQNSTLDPASLTAFLVKSQPQFEQARLELDQSLAARRNIQADRLSPRLRNLMVEKLDPIFRLAEDGLSLATALPGALGATTEGPKTYLLLVENQDELRPTGGFITSVGNLVISNGQVLSLDFEEAGELEDWSKPYPSAPWQLQQYMNSPVLVLRDSNWFTDFPTAAMWAEYLYAYNHSHSVDGVIAFDQHFLVMILGQIGPLEVEGASYPITDKNVMEFMRQAKVPPEGPIPVDWYRKEFIGNIAGAIMKDLVDGHGHNWRGLAQVLLQALKERHLLLQMDDPTLASIASKQGWDNAVDPGDGDFLMVTDTNIGFNKTNAVVQASLSYDVDLTDLMAPRSTLIVTHQNNASQNVPCIQWDTGEIVGEKYYPIDRCYWNYLRVYKPAGVEVLEATPHAVPGAWMLLGQGVPARVDDLEEEIPGVKGFGTLLVVPGGQSLNTSFTFALPPSIMVKDGPAGQRMYRLKVQKQPGTLAIPITIRIHLPKSAVVKSISEEAVAQDNHLLINSTLQTDVDLELIFSLP